VATLDDLTARIDAGERLSEQDAAALASSRDIITLGMLATTIRRRLRGNEVTYVRVLDLEIDDKANLKGATATTADSAGEVRVFSTPQTLDRLRPLISVWFDLLLMRLLAGGSEGHRW